MGLRHDKITEMCRNFRNTCEEFFVRNPIFLGGPSIICQIDESLFVNRQKYYRGRTSEHQVWVFGIVDTGYVPARGQMEIVARKVKAFLFVIVRRICLSSTINHSD